MSKKRVFVCLSVTAVIEIDSAVFDTVDDDWKDQLYNLRNDEEIAKHVAYNMIANNASLTRMEGFALLDDNNAKFIERPDWDWEDFNWLEDNSK